MNSQFYSSGRAEFGFAIKVIKIESLGGYHIPSLFKVLGCESVSATKFYMGSLSATKIFGVPSVP
jgi:hypothetical protein